MPKRTPARMRRLVTQWRRSGASQASFARRHEIPYWTFWYWCRKLSPPGATAPPAPPAFVPVRVTPDGEDGAVEVVFPAGERMRITAGVSVDLVRRVVTALRSSC